MKIEPVSTPNLASIEHMLKAHPRAYGYYLLKLVRLDPPLVNLRDEGDLALIFRQLDDSPHREIAQATSHQWGDYRVEASEAKVEIVNALIGGSDIGNVQNTIERLLAEDVWRQFEGQFSGDREYYVRTGFGSSTYAYQRGGVIVGRALAGALFVIEG